MFINEAIDYALTMYNRSKERPFSPLFNSFLVVVIRALCEIYGEPDIINPFITKNETNFDNNLMRFGFSEEKLLNFKNNMQFYYEWAKEASKKETISKCLYFSLIQEDLIDMMVCKSEESEDKIKFFCNLLYTEDNLDPKFKLFNMQVAVDKNRVKTYLNDNLFNEKAPTLPETILEAGAEYSINEEEIIKEITTNPNQKVILSSGNGFVDTVVLLSVITTLASVGFIVAVLLGR